MSKGRTIGRAGLVGMIAVSWISIAVIGGVWLYSMYADFQADAARIREERYEDRRSLVKDEVQDAVELVARIRRASAENLARKLESKIRDVRALNEVLGRDLAKGTDPTMLRVATVRLMAALDRSEARLYAIRGKTIYLFSPFPKWVNREDALSQVEAELEGVTNGQRKLALQVADGMSRYTLLVKVNEFEAQGCALSPGPAWRWPKKRSRKWLCGGWETFGTPRTAPCSAGPWRANPSSARLWGRTCGTSPMPTV